MTDDDPVKPDRAPWWPLLPLIPAVGALAVAIYGLDEARAHIEANPCISGSEVPWAGLFAALQTLGLVGGIVALLVAYSTRGTNTRVVAIVALIVGIAIWLLALFLQGGPYGWRCWRY